MRRLILSFIIITALTLGASAQSEDARYFGEKITAAEALTPTEFVTTVEQQGETTAKVTGEITEVCPKKGCWMTLDVDGQEMMVRFKDYGFFMPLDATGKTAVVQGQAKMETIDVATLRHYAEDAGKSAEEIDAITEPETKLSFVADGVILED